MKDQHDLSPTIVHQQAAPAERVMEADDTDALSQMVYAHSLVMRQGTEVAFPWYERSLKLSPSFALAHYLSGIFKSISGDTETAKLHIGRALDHSPCDREARRMHSGLSSLRIKEGDFSRDYVHAIEAMSRPHESLIVTQFAFHATHGYGDFENARLMADRIKAVTEPGRTREALGTLPETNEMRRKLEEAFDAYDID